MVLQRFQCWLRQPFPLLNDRRRTWRMVLIGFLFVTFFLYFFQPFGLQAAPGQASQIFILCLEYGMVTLVVLLLWGWVTRVLPYVFQEEKWQVWKEILANLAVVALIATGNLLYTHFRFDAPLSWYLLWRWQVVTWGVGIFPTLYGVFHKQLQLTRRFSTEAGLLSKKMEQQHEQTSADHSPVLINLQGENQGESLSLTTDQLHYLAAADNYVQVFYMENEQLKSRMLRSTLKKMEDALAAYPQFFRCHRTYLVNLDKVRHLTGNAQGYRLQLVHQEETVPVSRNLNEVIQKRLLTSFHR